jgi:CMP-N,N'-diacetyllegionaminic acid synthase
MYKGNRVLAVVPARGGSKGIPLKNLSKIGGKSLIEWVGAFLNRCNETSIIDTAVVSTDHKGIRDEAIRCGIAAPFARPQELSGDCVSDIDVLSHALEESDLVYRDRFDIVVMLQPTSPFRRTHHLFECLDMLIEGQRDSVITVSEADPKFSPLKQLRIVDDNLEYFDSRGAQIIARQQLEKMFFRNGSVYALTRDCVQKKKQVITEQTGAVVCNDPLVNIDTEEDILFAEYLLSSGKLKSFS